MSEREQALLDAMAKCKRLLILFEDEGRISAANGAEACFDAIDELRIAAPVARPEPAQPVAQEIGRTYLALESALGGIDATLFPQARAALVTHCRALYARQFYAAPPSHPAPSEAGAERQARMHLLNLVELYESRFEGRGPSNLFGPFDSEVIEARKFLAAQPAKGDAS